YIVARASGRIYQSRRVPLGETPAARSSLPPNMCLDLFPGKDVLRICFEFRDAPIEVSFLRFCERNLLGERSDAIPDLVNQRETLTNTQAINAERFHPCGHRLSPQLDPSRV